jgi:hypothetical protein
MHTTARHLFSIGGLMLAAAAVPAAAASAQASTLQPVRVTAEAVSRADRLRIEAEALPTRVDQFSKAAKLYEKSAKERAAGDTATPTLLRTAAFLRYYSGDIGASTKLMEKAAQRSVEHGDVLSAATAYIDAAIIAAEDAQGSRALDLGRRAEQLAASAALTDAQRDALRGRMASWHEVKVALGER